MAFTGIHVINPDVLSLIPKGVYYDILDAYRALISKGAKLAPSGLAATIGRTSGR